MSKYMHWKCFIWLFSQNSWHLKDELGPTGFIIQLLISATLVRSGGGWHNRILLYCECTDSKFKRTALSLAGYQEMRKWLTEFLYWTGLETMAWRRRSTWRAPRNPGKRGRTTSNESFTTSDVTKRQQQRGDKWVVNSPCVPPPWTATWFFYARKKERRLAAGATRQSGRSATIGTSLVFIFSSSPHVVLLATTNAA